MSEKTVSNSIRPKYFLNINSQNIFVLFRTQGVIHRIFFIFIVKRMIYINIFKNMLKIQYKYLILFNSLGIIFQKLLLRYFKKVKRNILMFQAFLLECTLRRFDGMRMVCMRVIENFLQDYILSLNCECWYIYRN